MDDFNEELGIGELNATFRIEDEEEEIGIENETPKQIKRLEGPTIMFDVTRIRSLGEKKVVRYNEDKVHIGENGEVKVFHRVCDTLSCSYHIYIWQKCDCKTES